MKLVTYGRPDDYSVGAWLESGVVDLSAAADRYLPGTSMAARTLYGRGIKALDDVRFLVDRAIDNRELLIDPLEITLGPAVPYPGKIICVGLNYRRHAEETRQQVPTVPVVFSKFGNALAAHGSVIDLPPVSHQVDYEAELAVVIGTRARNISQHRALSAVFGYATANDVSARDIQRQSSQWLMGKTLPGFLPIGPYVLTAEGLPNPQHVRIRTWVNDELRQDSNTSDMIFSVAALISHLSRYFALEPGDLVLTGTPEGVILGMPDPVWLKDGDVVAIDIDGLGRLENRFRDASGR